MDDRSRERYLGSAALPVKDMLRGVRFGLRSFRNTAASLQNKLPGPIGQLGAATISHMDRLATEVDRNSSLVVHRLLDPLIISDRGATALSGLITQPNASVLFAKVAYDHLKPVVSYLCRHDDRKDSYFISEMLAALAYRRAADSLGRPSERVSGGWNDAARLLVSLLETGVIRTASSSNAAYCEDPAARRLARTACFTLMLWLIVERSGPPDDEETLLFAAADLASMLGETIDQAGDDAGMLAELLQSHAKVI